MSEPLITAISPRWEAELATAFDRNPRVHLVRRCADLAELLGSVDAGLGRVAVVSADVRGLDRSAVAFLNDQGLSTIGIYAPGDVEQEHRLRRFGVAATIAADAGDEAIDAGLAAALGEGDDIGAGPDGGGLQGRPGGDPAVAHPTGAVNGVESGGADRPADWDDADHSAGTDDGWGGWQPAGAPASGDEPADVRVDAGEAEHRASPTDRGRVIAIWGTPGAPGRTTTAVNLAAEIGAEQRLARGQDKERWGVATDGRVLLVDADTHAACVAQMLAILDEAPGLAAATRLADQGRLSPDALLSVAPRVMDKVRVLTGLPRADRWPELSDHALADVIEACRQVADWVVIDCASSLEQDEDITFDTRAPRRNGATLTVLEEADDVVVVGAADPVGLQRLIRAVEQIAAVSDSRITVVVSKVRSSAVGSDPVSRVRNALHRFAGVEDPIVVVDDRSGLDAALLAGCALREVRPASPARQGYRDLGRAFEAITASSTARKSPRGLPSAMRARHRGVRRRGSNAAENGDTAGF